MQEVGFVAECLNQFTVCPTTHVVPGEENHVPGHKWH
jgi:hypothetical protein